MKKLKALALILAIIMLFTLVAACRNNADTPSGTPATTPAGTQGGTQGGTQAGTPAASTDSWDYRVELSPSNPVTINTMIVSGQLTPNASNKLTKLLADELGVTINYEIVPGDQQDTRIGTMLASGDYPELIGQSQLTMGLIEGGAMLKLDDMVDSGEFPHLARHVAPFRSRMSYLGGAAPDGNGLYIFPAYGRFYDEFTDTQSMSTGFFIQKAVLEWAGFPSLDNWTLEKYFDLIEGYLDEHQVDENGVALTGMAFNFADRAWSLTNAPQFLAGHPNNGGVIIENGQASIYINTTYAERYYRILNDAFHRGLIDVQSFTRSSDEYTAALANGNVIAISDQRWAFGSAVDALMAADRVNRTWVPTIPTLDGITPFYSEMPVPGSNQGYGISVTAPNPGLVMTFLDTMLSQEWQVRLAWGIEGEDFYVDDNGRFYRDEEQRLNWMDLGWRAENRLMALYDQMPKISGVYPDPGFGQGNAWSPGDQLEEFQDGLRPYDRMFLEAYGKGTWMDFQNPPRLANVYFPAWNIPVVGGSMAQINSALVEDLTIEWVPRLVMADPGAFDGMWAQFMDLVNAIDIQPYLDTINAGVQQRLDLWAQDSQDWQNTPPLAPLPGN